MNQVFPGNKTIFLVRNPDEIIKSGWWAKAKNHKRIIRDLTTFQETCFEISQSTNSPYINYNVLRNQDLAAIKSTIYDPLGLPFKEEVIQESLNHRLTHGKKQATNNLFLFIQIQIIPKNRVKIFSLGKKYIGHSAQLISLN